MSRALRVVFAIAALATAAPASAHAPATVTHTYQVSYRLAGTYGASIQYTKDGQGGYCGGTGYVEGVQFDTTFAGKLRVKLDGEKIAHKNILLPIDPGTWSQQGKSVPEGAECDQVQNQACDGQLGFQGNESSKLPTVLSAVGKKHKIRFEFNVPEAFSEVSKSSDCHQTEDFGPPPSFTFAGAIDPYMTVYFDIPIARLGSGTHFSGQAHVLKFPKGYNVSSCNNQPPCVGALTKFVRTITVKQR